jgi:hypothetical protein
MWTKGSGRLAAFGVSMALFTFVAANPALAADSPLPVASDAGQTAATVTDTVSRTYAAISIMKTKHDTVKNSISNVR